MPGRGYAIWAVEIRSAYGDDIRSMKSDERRQHPRYPVRSEVTVHILSSLFVSAPPEPPLEGTIYDLSIGGLSILIPQAVPLSTTMKCEIRVSEFPVSIPTLTHVRWVGSSPSGVGVRVGLHFLL